MSVSIPAPKRGRHNGRHAGNRTGHVSIPAPKRGRHNFRGRDYAPVFVSIPAPKRGRHNRGGDRGVHNSVSIPAPKRGRHNARTMEYSIVPGFNPRPQTGATQHSKPERPGGRRLRFNPRPQTGATQPGLVCGGCTLGGFNPRPQTGATQPGGGYKCGKSGFCVRRCRICSPKKGQNLTSTVTPFGILSSSISTL